MKMLNSEITNLLDRLYNLRGEDSVVLVSMEKERNSAFTTKERTSVLKAELQNKINELNSEESVLAEQGEKLTNVLATIRKAEFETVINHLNIDFDPEAIKAQVEKALPLTIEKVATEKKKSAEELVKIEDEMNDAITKIEELGIRKDEALSNQNRLNRYFELALSSNINITRDEITSLLAKFDFNEEEQREAAKILMFPEDGLFEYEKSLKDLPINGKSISEVIQEAKEVTPIVEISPIITEPKETIEDNSIVAPLIVEKPVESIEIVQPKEATKEDLIKLLTDLGFDYLDFTNNDFTKLLENYDADTFKENTKTIKELNINIDVFVDNVELLYDKEMKSKLEKLTSIGKKAQDIYLNPNVLVKYNLNELDSAINVLRQSGLEPKNVPLMAY